MSFGCPIQVGEDDYHQLKHDQCLRVDFTSFPRKFIELLESCRSDAERSNSGAALDGTRRGESDWEDEASPIARGEHGALRQGDPRPGGPSFLARLDSAVPGGFSLFSIVETNPFKELTHLSLKFRAGNDSAIKAYLAARLRQVGCNQREPANKCWTIVLCIKLG